MFHNLLFILLIVSVKAQINGEFWWLDRKLNNLKNVKPTPPKIDVSDFQNDESSKIIFRDDDFYTNKLKPIVDRTSKLTVYENTNRNEIVWPTSKSIKNRNDNNVFTTQNSVKANDEEIKIVWPSDKHMKNHDVDVSSFTNDLKKDKEDIKTVWTSNEHMKNHDIDVTKYINNVSKKEDEPKTTTGFIEDMINHDVEMISTTKNMKDINPILNKFEDVLVFSYPKNNKLVTASKVNAGTTESTLNTSSQTTAKEIENQSENTNIIFNTAKLTTNKDKETQNICTYIIKKNCLQRNGFVYEYSRRVPKTSSDEPLVCCILPIESLKLKEEKLSSTNLHLSSTSSSLNRFKRSEIEESIALKQRDFLLKQKFTSQPLNAKPISTPLTKIVTPPQDDYVDPYWNVKNSKFQNTENTKLGNTKYDYYSDDSVEEYADELPKPGLIGLYSDHAMSPSSWSYTGNNKDYSYGGVDDEYEDDDNESFGYSTIDPRQGIKKTKGKVQKLTTPDDATFDAESHTINFHSNPDFHVFQGFKLLNLFRNTSRVHIKNTNKKSGQDYYEEVLVDTPEELGEVGDKQLFNGCGKVMKKVNDRGTRYQYGEAINGSHPWMALVVLTKRRHNVLCYAALVHPRAAVTVADCVQGTAPGDITVIAGLWDLADRSRSRNRVATVQVHPKYKPGSMDNNLAILHWMRPLKLSANVQPACLGQPEIGEECKFFGWGGLDQGIQQQRSRWQRVTIRACTGRLGPNRSSSSRDAFCVSSPRGTVTGMGGPLICEVGGHSTIVGAVVTRENGYVLLPVRDWTMKSEHLISGD